MDALQSSLVIILLMVALLAIGVWLFLAFLLIGILGLVFVNGMDVSRVGSIMSQVIWRSSSSSDLAAIPLFIMMGELIFKTDIASRLFRGLTPWVSKIPGKLLHANVVGCTVFAALCGSSVATTATIGRITIAELFARKYDKRLVLGSLAGAGSFGLMIPPSINLIIYGILAEVSVSKLFAAGLLPGLLLATLYSGYIIIRCILVPGSVPNSVEHVTWMDRLKGFVDLSPIILLIFVILGSIYSGWATPSESAAIGVVMVVIMGKLSGQLSLKVLFDALLSTTKISTMIMSLLAGAGFLAVSLGYLHVPSDVAQLISSLNLSPFGLLIVLTVFYIMLGAFLDGISLMVMTLSTILPIVLVAGFDPIWFGIFMIVMAELALITPPIGMNLFVIQGLTKISIWTIGRAALPFFGLLLLGELIIALFPSIVLWLPKVIF